MSRFVLDANILLAALAGRPDAPPALLLAGIHSGDLEAVACPLLVGEVLDNLEKPYFRAKLSQLEAYEAIDAFSAIALMLDDPTDVDAILRDPGDDYLERDNLLIRPNAANGTREHVPNRQARVTQAFEGP